MQKKNINRCNCLTEMYVKLPAATKFHWSGGGEKNSSSMGKLRAICIDLTLLNPNVAIKMIWLPPLLRAKG